MKVGDVIAQADHILNQLANGNSYDKDTIVSVKDLLDIANNNGEGHRVLRTCTFPPGTPTPTGGATPTGYPTPTGGATPTGNPTPTGGATPTGNPTPSGYPTPDPECDDDDDDYDHDGRWDDDDDDDDGDGWHDLDDGDDDNDGWADWYDGDDNGSQSSEDYDHDGNDDDQDDDDDQDGKKDWEDEDDDNDGWHDWEDGDDDDGCGDDDSDDDGHHDDEDDDDDNDGYKDEDEYGHIGTHSKKKCGVGGWPADLVRTGGSADTLDIHDLISFMSPVRRLDKDPGEAGFDTRWDLVPGEQLGSTISIQDITALLVGPTAYPPMFDGQRAFDRSCSN
jgi:hypothetical protein